MPRFAQVRLAKFKSLVNKLLGMNRVYGLVILIMMIMMMKKLKVFRQNSIN